MSVKSLLSNQEAIAVFNSAYVDIAIIFP